MLQLLLYFNLFLSIRGIFSPDTLVVQLTKKNFDKLILQSERVWFVKFYAPWCGHCLEFAPEFDRAAKALKGVVRLGAVNIDVETELADQYGIEAYPTVKIFILDKKKPEVFRGERNANTLTNAAMSAVQRKVNHQLSGKPDAGPRSRFKDVIKLTDNNFKDLVLNSNDMWMINFYAPWCQTCQRFEAIWADAALELKDKVKFGAVDVTVNKLTADHYKIERYPTIKYFPVGFKKDIFDYNDKRNKNEIVEFATKTLLNSKPGKKIKQIINHDTFEKVCAGEQLCVISFLPHLWDCRSNCRRTYLKMLRKLSERFKERLWGWLWSEGSVQVQFEDTFDIGGYGYPAVVVLNMKKMKYTTFRGAFSEEGIGEFLRDLSYGRGSVADLSGKIEIFEVEAWDGTDSQLPKVYEEDEETDTVQVKSIKEIDEELNIRGTLEKENVEKMEVKIEMHKGNWNEKVGKSITQKGCNRKIVSQARIGEIENENSDNISEEDNVQEKLSIKEDEIIEEGETKCKVGCREQEERKSKTHIKSDSDQEMKKESTLQKERSEIKNKKPTKVASSVGEDEEVCRVGETEKSRRNVLRGEHELKKERSCEDHEKCEKSKRKDNRKIDKNK